MKPWERRVFQISIFLVATTGLLYGWARFFGERMGEFGPEPHPWQGTLQHLHILAGPMLVFMAGWMVRGHALPALAGGMRSKRYSGMVLLTLIAPMVLSGYMRQVSVAPVWQAIWSWAHMGSAGIFVMGVVAHFFKIREA